MCIYDNIFNKKNRGNRYVPIKRKYIIIQIACGHYQSKHVPEVQIQIHVDVLLQSIYESGYGIGSFITMNNCSSIMKKRREMGQKIKKKSYMC